MVNDLEDGIEFDYVDWGDVLFVCFKKLCVVIDLIKYLLSVFLYDSWVGLVLMVGDCVLVEIIFVNYLCEWLVFLVFFDEVVV